MLKLLAMADNVQMGRLPLTLDPTAMFEGKSRSDAEGLALQLGPLALSGN